MRSANLLSAGAFVMTICAIGSVHAQLDEIVVTAQKTEQTLQEVPIAVSVLGADQIENAFASNNLESLTTLLPSVSFRKGTTNANSAITVRGIGTISFSDAAEPSVATVVDGVVLGRSGQAFGDLYDIERIEVLRGPQGTLFGKNASAGVVNIVTKRPNQEEFEGYISASYFEDQEYQVKGRVSGPISDTVSASLTVSRSEFDGFITNLFNNREVNGYDRWGGRAQVLWAPDETFNALFTYEHSESDDDCCADIPALNTNANRFANSQAAPGGEGIVDPGDGSRPVADIQLDTRIIDQDFETRTINNFDAFSIELNKEFFGGHTLTSITSFREWINTEFREGDFTSTEGFVAEEVNFGDVNFLLHDVGTRDNSQFTQEFRIQSPAGQRLNYQLGGYIFTLDVESDFTRDASCQANGGGGRPNDPILAANPGVSCNANDIVSATGFSSVDFENYSLFGQADYDLFSGINVLFGFRLTRDEVEFTHSRINNDEFGRQGVGVRADLPTSQFPFPSGGFAIPNEDVPTGELVGGVPVLVDVPANSGRVTNTDFSIKAGVNADLADLFQNDGNFGNIYFTYAQGYKGPAFDVFFNQGFGNLDPLDPEESDHFEVGYKLQLPSFVLNLAAYTTDISGFQANAFDNTSGVTITRLTNAGDVRTRGIELDAIWSPTDWVSFTGGFALNEAEIQEFNSPVDSTTGLPIPVSNPAGLFNGVDLLFSPDFNYTFGANFNYPISEKASVFLNTTFAHVDEQESLLPSVGAPADGTTLFVEPDFPIAPQSLLPSYNLWDLSVGVEWEEKYRLTFIVKNLHDESFVTTNSGDGFRFQIPREADRYVGANFRAEF